MIDKKFEYAALVSDGAKKYLSIPVARKKVQLDVNTGRLDTMLKTRLESPGKGGRRPLRPKVSDAGHNGWTIPKFSGSCVLARFNRARDLAWVQKKRQKNS